MLLSLTEPPHSSAPITSTPNKLTNGMTSLIANGTHSTENEDAKEVHSSPDNRLLDSSVIESKDGSTSDFNTTGENAMSDWRDESCGVKGSLTSRIPSPSGVQVLPGVTDESGGCEDEEKEKSDVTGYTRCQNGTMTSEAEGLKRRLLSALAKLIPHEESLSLRVLVNYTIDGADSDCLVIDETLRRQQGATTNGESGTETMNAVCGSVRKRTNSGTESPDNKRQRRLHQLLYKESPVLDLSRQDSGFDACATSLASGKGGVAAHDKSISMEMPNGGLRTTASNLFNGSNDCGNSTLASSEVNTITNGMPMLDPSVFALLPFLQQQLQQQQEKEQQRQALLQQQEKEQKNTSQLGDTGHAGQSEDVYPHRQPIQSELTSENLLVRQLQALVDSSGNSSASTGSINDGTNKSSTGAYANKITGNTNFVIENSSVDNIAATLLNGNMGIVSSSGIGLGNPANAVTNSVVGLPFLNAFSTDQLSALLTPTSFLSQSKSSIPSTVTVNSIIDANATNRPSLLNGTQQHQHQQRHQPHEDNGRTPATGFTSVNLGSATLLNLRDKMTGLETLGILPVPGNRSFAQPMASLLSHLSQTTHGISSVPASTPVSLQKLSSFSHFFNSLANTSLVPTQPSSSTPISASVTTVPLASVSTIASNVGVASNPFSLPLPLSLPLSLPRTTLLPTSLGSPTSMESTTMAPTTLLTMLPNITPTNDVVNMLNSLNNVGSLERNQLVTLETLNAAVDRMKNQVPANLESGDGRKMGSDTGMTPITKSLDTSGFVNSPGSAGESHDSSPSSANNLMFGRRLVNNRRFICNQCRKNYTSLAELNRHTLEAHNSFKCTICSAHFTQRSNLQRHSLKHVGFKPFTCNLCKKEYYRKDHLVRHIEVTHPNHDPKMNITVHLTSSECLEYLDRINTGKQTPSPGELETQTVGDLEMAEEEYLKIDEGTPEESGAFHTESPEEQQFQSVIGAGESLSPAQ